MLMAAVQAITGIMQATTTAITSTMTTAITPPSM